MYENVHFAKPVCGIKSAKENPYIPPFLCSRASAEVEKLYSPSFKTHHFCCNVYYIIMKHVMRVKTTKTTLELTMPCFPSHPLE